MKVGRDHGPGRRHRVPGRRATARPSRGRGARTRRSPTSTRSTGAVTSPPGSSRSSSPRSCAPPSGRCAEEEETMSDTQPHRRPRARRLRRRVELERRDRAAAGEGPEVTAPPNPLRGIAIDSAYIASVLEQIPGPVLLVGHSYGGAVITNAATDATNVVGLVYVAAFAPDEGEALGEVTPTSKDSVLNRRSSRSVPGERRHGDGVRHRSREGPRGVRGRPARRGHRADRRHAAADRRGGVLRGERPAGLEAAARRGPSSPRATMRSARTSSARWPSAPARPSPRSRART